jgi:hypothetical protein
MGNSDDGPMPPDDISDTLIQRVKSLDLPELISLLSCIEQRIEVLRTPIEEEIEANAAGEVLDIENHGAYALVRKHPPGPDGTGINTDVVSLYHVRREQRMDGTESLHWAYLGDVHNPEQIRCDSCSGILDKTAPACPHCGRENPETEE